MSKHWLFLVMSMFLISTAWGQLGGDVTRPGDTIIGVPNNGNWPGSEGPPMAINNDNGTKYLHFSGATQPTGFRVKPSMLQTIVGGISLTTANDAPERTPATYELSGSNHGINGPWTVIAAGPTNLPATIFTKNTIEFSPLGAYDYYQVMFPTCAGPGQNSMQIAEVELLEGYLPFYSPVPRDTFEKISTDTTISWQVDPELVDPVFTVYFGTDPNVTLNNSITGVTAAELDPVTILGSPLADDTTYYWSVNIAGDPQDPNSFAGAAWSFTTAPAVPVITQEPDDVWSEAGKSAVFYFGAEVIGHPEQILAFQWYHEPNDLPTVALADGDGVSGANSDTLTLTNLDAADVGQYYCIATGDAGSVESRRVSLQLIELLGHWPLDGDAADISGYDNDGIARGEAFGFDDGILGQAANFDNLGLFEIPNPAHFDQANGSITVYCWVKSGGTGDWEPFVAKFGENAQGWQLRKRAVSAIHTFTLRGTSGDDDPTPAAPNLFDNQWHQVVGTFDGVTRRIYMDGREILSFADAGEIAPTSAPVSIGGRITDTGEYQAFFNGMIDDVRIYKGPMPPLMVAQLYTQASGLEICASAIPGDLSGPMGVPDCIINLYDLAALASNWLHCTNVDVTRCP
ncbi:MAG: hypothetical protein IH624_20190 [Phycisphaerae bacterium]|nr:hypothetical protein [Phycisphaerae bacterium]